MKYSKEVLWHFTCEFCKGWWSIAASDEWHPSDKVLYCSHCGKEHAMYGDGDPPLEDALDQDEDTGYTGIM